MNVVVFGAGAIGSLFGGILSKKNNVVLIGRKNHVHAIKENGLIIKGETKIHATIQVTDCIENIGFTPDLLILTVKSYDTREAMTAAIKAIDRHTMVLTLQNGLGNIETIAEFVSRKQIIAAITTHGSIFEQPGIIRHTGIGSTKLGEPNGSQSDRIKQIASMFSHVGIAVSISDNILRDIMGKAIINASINPLTSVFQCKNGYLLKNPILTSLMQRICTESTLIANAAGFSFSTQEMLDQTVQVIRETAENYSSMVQSIQRKSQTEIDAINGRLAEIGRQYDCNNQLNHMLTRLMKSFYKE